MSHFLKVLSPLTDPLKGKDGYLKSASPILKKWIAYCQSALRKACDILYPPVCLSCQELSLPDASCLCETCQDLWIWTEELEHSGVAAACPPLGPALQLARRLERGDFFLAHTIASLMMLYWDEIGWQVPDRIWPLHIARYPNWSASTRHERLLADQFSWQLLQKKSASWRSISQIAGEEILLISLGEDLDALAKARQALAPYFPKRVRLLSFLS